MTSEVKSKLLADAKETLQIKTDAFDITISGLIDACVEDLVLRNAIQESQMTANPIKPSIWRAIMTYVRWTFGDPENPERLKADYDEQKATLMMTTGFTNWEES